MTVIHIETSKKETALMDSAQVQQSSAPTIYCPRCGNIAIKRGKRKGIPRFKCQNLELTTDGSKLCGRMFNALTGTPLARLHHPDKNIGKATRFYGGTDELSMLLSTIRT
jgi:transposase-like protein